MSKSTHPDTANKPQNSILAFSSQATTAFRWFTKEDFLNMMSEMTMEEIQLDLERFKALEEYEICKKVEYVLEAKKNAELLNVNSIFMKVNI